MPLNKCSGDMYADIDMTINIIRGRCPFDCNYCFSKTGFRKNILAYQKPFKIVESELKVAYPSGTRIFIGSMTDMWMAPEDQIARVLARCRDVNSVLSTPGLQVHWVFQTKDPGMMIKWVEQLPEPVTLITTVETNLDAGYKNISQAPMPTYRLGRLFNLQDMLKLHRRKTKIDISVTMEPIMEFDDNLAGNMFVIKPRYVSIGAATPKEYEKHGMSMPHWRDVVNLVEHLTRLDVPAFIEVRIKKNLLRLAPTKKEKLEFRDSLFNSGAWLTWEWLHVDGAMKRYEAWKQSKLFKYAEDNVHQGFVDMINKPEPFMKFSDRGE